MHAGLPTSSNFLLATCYLLLAHIKTAMGAAYSSESLLVASINAWYIHVRLLASGDDWSDDTDACPDMAATGEGRSGAGCGADRHHVSMLRTISLATEPA
jgi:hypothetical protein